MPALDRRRIDPESERATVLIAELTALPAGHPARSGLRDETITAWLPMARRLARRYAGRGEAMDDLIQAATVGLIKAVDRYDESLGVDFTGYAIPTIVGELKRHFRDRTWSVRVPRRLQEMHLAVSNAGSVLAQSLGRAPTVADIAVYLGVGEEAVLEGLETAYAYRATSLSTPVGPSGTGELADSLGAEDGEYARSDLHLSLGPAMQHLTERERIVVTLRFYGNHSQSQIAERVGVSQMHVSRLLSGALAKLRKQLGPDAY
jgi:RNA polymerase sigma-B factor